MPVLESIREEALERERSGFLADFPYPVLVSHRIHQGILQTPEASQAPARRQSGGPALRARARGQAAAGLVRDGCPRLRALWFAKQDDAPPAGCPLGRLRPTGEHPPEHPRVRWGILPPGSSAES